MQQVSCAWNKQESLVLPGIDDAAHKRVCIHQFNLGWRGGRDAVHASQNRRIRRTIDRIEIQMARNGIEGHGFYMTHSRVADERFLVEFR